MIWTEPCWLDDLRRGYFFLCGVLIATRNTVLLLKKKTLWNSRKWVSGHWMCYPVKSTNQWWIKKNGGGVKSWKVDFIRQLRHVVGKRLCNGWIWLAGEDHGEDRQLLRATVWWFNRSAASKRVAKEEWRTRSSRPVHQRWRHRRCRRRPMLTTVPLEWFISQSVNASRWSSSKKTLATLNVSSMIIKNGLVVSCPRCRTDYSINIQASTWATNFIVITSGSQ